MANAAESLQITELDGENFDLDLLVNQLEGQLSDQLYDLEFMEEDRKIIGTPESLGKVIEETVMTHINNQMGVLSSEEFIKNNHGNQFDPRNSAHTQTTENFKKNKIATHNNEIDYQKRHDDQQAKFQKDENGNTKMKLDHRSQLQKEVIETKARKSFDKDRETGSKAVNKDHTISAAEIMRDSEVNCHLSKEEQIAFANSNINLHDMDSNANQSKKDSTMTEFLNSERGGKKPAERFDINEEKCREDDQIAREELEKQKKEGEKKSRDTGKQSQKEEIGRMASSAAKAAAAQFVITCLKDLLLAVIRKLIIWFKSTAKSIETFLDSLKESFQSFATKLKNEFSKHLENAGSTALVVIVSAIFKPVGSIIRKFGSMIKQGFKSVKEAFNYLSDPENKSKPLSIKIAQIGKIIVTGLTATGVIVLGGVIETGLSSIPVLGQVLAFPIPLLGSLASIIGLFMGALVSGIIGAMLLNFIDKFIANKLKDEATKQNIAKGNEAMQTSHLLLAVREEKFNDTKTSVESSITARHQEASKMMTGALEIILENERKIAEIEDDQQKTIVVSEHEATFSDMLNKLNGI